MNESINRRTFTFGLAAAASAPLLPGLASAQEAWPSQAVKIIVPFPAGGSADVLPRIVAEALGSIWKQPIVIENKPGAGGNIGAEAVSVA